MRGGKPERQDAAQAASVRSADPAEGERLRDIAIAAKAHWGHDLDWVREWAARGDFSPRALRERTAFVAEADGRVVGWAAVSEHGESAWLDDLWVDPGWMRRGIGARLFRHAAEHARRLGAARMEWEAEPNAVGFYERMGAHWVRDQPPNEWGRVVPVLQVDL